MTVNDALVELAKIARDGRGECEMLVTILKRSPGTGALRHVGYVHDIDFDRATRGVVVMSKEDTVMPEDRLALQGPSLG